MSHEITSALVVLLCLLVVMLGSLVLGPKPPRRVVVRQPRVHVHPPRMHVVLLRTRRRRNTQKEVGPSPVSATTSSGGYPTLTDPNPPQRQVKQHDTVAIPRSEAPTQVYAADQNALEPNADRPRCILCKRQH